MTSYNLIGDFYEACDCEVICSCWAEKEPEMGSCTGIFAWKFKASSVVDAVNVAGSNVMVITTGASCDESDHLLILIDASSVAKKTALETAFNFNSGAWSRVFNTRPSAVSAAIDADITIGNKSISAKPRPGPLPAIGDFIATANYKMQHNIFLTSAPANNLITRISGQVTPKLEIGVVERIEVGGKFTDDGLNILADTNTHPPYSFDVDVEQVSFVKGSFYYVTP